METQNSATVGMPEFKLAKVGTGRERKRGGLAWFGARGAGAGFGGAAGGSGFGGLAGMSVGKMLLALLVAGGLSSAAWQFGRSFANAPTAGGQPPKRAFSDADSRRYADTSNVIKNDSSIPNSLGFVSGSTDGLTPEERAKKQAADAEAARKAADEEAARKAAEDAKNKADDAAAKKNAEQDAKADPAALARGGSPNSGLNSGKFGRLSSSLGGGGGALAGGAGLSGGVNGSFGSRGLGAKGQGGAMSAMHTPSKPGYSSGAHAATARSGSKGFARRQLDNAFAQTKNATSAGKSESAAASAAQPFDNSAGQGSIIAGPGVSAGGPKSGTADGGAPVNTGSGGGPIASGGGAPACPQGMAPDINSNCQPISTPHAKDGASYQWMIDLAKVLMGLVMVVSLIILALRYYASWCTFGTALAIAQALHTVILVLGAMITMLGIAIMAATGDKMMGGIITGIGAFITASFMFPEILSGASLVQLAIGGMLLSAGGFLAASKIKASGMQ